MRAMLACVLLALGCDSRASDPHGAAGQRSKELETCGASSQCLDDLRCFDHVCRRILRSTIGDYYAALGALAKSHGDLEAAITAYTEALAHYEAEKLSLPPDVDCAYGAALAAAKQSKEHAELGARVLHRCILAVPVGSRLRDQALTELAGLADAGLDPVLLGAVKPAEVYLTKGPAKPATDKLVVTVTASPVPTGKTYQAIPDKLAEAGVHAALVACWEAYNAASKKDELGVTVGVKVSYTPSEYEDEAGSFATKVEAPAAMPAGPDATADACVRQIVEPAIKALKITDAFATKLAIAVAPGPGAIK